MEGHPRRLVSSSSSADTRLRPQSSGDELRERDRQLLRRFRNLSPPHGQIQIDHDRFVETFTSSMRPASGHNRAVDDASLSAASAARQVRSLCFVGIDSKLSHTAQGTARVEGVMAVGTTFRPVLASRPRGPLRLDLQDGRAAWQPLQRIYRVCSSRCGLHTRTRDRIVEIKRPSPTPRCQIDKTYLGGTWIRGRIMPRFHQNFG